MCLCQSVFCNNFKQSYIWGRNTWQGPKNYCVGGKCNDWLRVKVNESIDYMAQKALYIGDFQQNFLHYYSKIWSIKHTPKILTHYRHLESLPVAEWSQLHVNCSCVFLQHHQHLRKKWNHFSFKIIILFLIDIFSPS